MLAAFVGTVTYIICEAAGQKPLATMSKLITVFICIDIALRVIVPVFYSAKEKVDAIEKKVDSIRQVDWLEEQLNGPERRMREKNKPPLQ